jgi:hypothetical protein
MGEKESGRLVFAVYGKKEKVTVIFKMTVT